MSEPARTYNQSHAPRACTAGRAMEYAYHGDLLAPRQQRFGRYYALTRDDRTAHALASQPIDLSRPHPLTQAGETEFNTLVWAPPKGERAGEVLVCDSTQFSTLFGGDESLERFWKNIALAT